MEDWLTKARESFPELLDKTSQNRDYNSPTDLWIDLFGLLANSYKEQPINDDLIGRIYDYAAWCFAQPQTDDVETDLSSATAVGLIEDIPLDPKISDDLYRWMSVESFLGFENLFRNHLDTEDAYRSFRDQFMEKKKRYAGPSRI
ncbi:MAG: hypothetical protein LAO78_07500 [Acidobacteriia bacterium]|nr:hypothetical protein [Terriglobia bacterium]